VLVSLARDGDETAFEELVCRQQHQEFAVALRMISQYQDAEDGIQDAHSSTPDAACLPSAARPVSAPGSPASCSTSATAAAADWYGMITTDQGRTRVAARVVGAVTRLAAQEVPHVSIAFGRRRTTRDKDPATIAGTAGESATNVGVARSQVVIDVKIVIEMGPNIPTLADQVRRVVRTGIERFTGLTAAEVDVTVVAVLPRASR
jgi:uncharacterized alkaline shock family protein YloU